MKTTNHLPKTLVILMMLLTSTAIGQEQTQPIVQETPQPSINSSYYRNAFGLRVGGTSGLTYKHIFANSHAFEAILGLWPHAIGLTALYEKNINAGTPGLNFYYGIGGHANVGDGRYRGYYGYYYANDTYAYVRRDYFAFGIDGIIGLEYKFRPVPFAVSADIKPFVETNQDGYGYLGIDPSIGVKLTF
jgi:hypothetical protein